MGWGEEGGNVWIWKGGGPSLVATPLGDAHGRSEVSELLIARLIDIYNKLSGWKEDTIMNKGLKSMLNYAVCPAGP